jgi:hypothetical protein
MHCRRLFRGRFLLVGVFPAVAIAAVRIAIVAGATSPSNGAISLAAIDLAYEQNFDSLASTPNGSNSNVLPTGWMLAESGPSARNDGRYTVSTGSDNAGDVYSFGTQAGNADRARSGREYRIAVQCVDRLGNPTNGVATVNVPRSLGK